MVCISEIHAVSDEVVFSARNGLGLVLLNRPEALNALSLGQIILLTQQLQVWMHDDTIKAVLIEGAGDRAFCAGGDIRAMADAGRRGDSVALQQFFSSEYRLNRLIKIYPKPFLAFMDGITMGGGVGLSVHGTRRIATERTVFAMPETGIGLFPDVGGTFFLPRMPGQTGLYLALTGARMTAADTVFTGAATHFMPSNRRDNFLDALACALEGCDVARALDAVDGVLGQFSEDAGPVPLQALQEEIRRCFSGASVAMILKDLAAEGTRWACQQREELLRKSPLSLLVTFNQMQRGAELGFDAAMALEYRLAPRMALGHDFLEGVRAALIDKDRNPVWVPENIDSISPAEVEAYFRPAEEGELVFC
ncbi:enoyl-CoA hydratase/isomerase family protein [Haematospirillum sp. H1815]|uniref:enoyl-CoA hydratase/isomerase family protein n=1 Tax=Haematospirillum sp. H1815 TaxID=2723108 RepID=UPI00143BDDC5|nr:enoyl-CoA hydratase/isomerase family protein [Haematospirillum sp. H1815]NKD76402.1 enoyl-CoA hydratase/isomerase family protein [Haematospirillum sp. H1815]